MMAAASGKQPSANGRRGRGRPRKAIAQSFTVKRAIAHHRPPITRSQLIELLARLAVQAALRARSEAPEGDHDE
jgi:hypothetical protein